MVDVKRLLGVDVESVTGIESVMKVMTSALSKYNLT